MRRLMKWTWIVLMFVLFAGCSLCALTGCDRDVIQPAGPTANQSPPAPPPPLNIIKVLRDRKPIAACTDQELEARATQDAALGEVAAHDAALVDREIKGRWVKGWEKWSFRLGLGGIVLGLLAGAGILWATKLTGWRLAGMAAGGLWTLAGLSFAVAQIVAHWHVLLWVGAVLLVLLVIASVYYLVNDKVAALVDAVRVLGKDVNVEALRDRLADAQVHTTDTLKALVARVTPVTATSEPRPGYNPPPVQNVVKPPAPPLAPMPVMPEPPPLPPAPSSN